MPPPSRLSHVASLLGSRAYATYTAGNAASLVGTWMHRVGVGWLTWELTQSATWLGAIAFADLFPSVLVAPFAGAAADRWDRLGILRLAAMAALGLTIALFVLSAVGALDILALFCLTLALGIVTGIAQPARLALIAGLVPRADLTTAVAINSIVFNLARFIGPMLAGLAISGSGVALVFALNALSYGAFLVALLRLPPPSDQRRPGAGEARCDTDGLGAALAIGLRYVLGHRAFAPLLGLLLITNLCGRPFVELLPGFAARVFAAGPEGLALMTSAIGLGAIAGAIWLIGQSETRRLALVTIISTLSLALAIVLFILTETLPVALPVLFAAGTAMVGAGVGTHTLLQVAVASALRGRVLALYGLIFRGGPAVGALLIGPIADRVGLAMPVGAGAIVVAIAAAALLWRRRPFISALDTARKAAGNGHDGERGGQVK